MAFGVEEPPALSPAAILQAVDFPVSRDELVLTAQDEGSPVETINFLRSLPNRDYESVEDCLREFAEASARAGMGTKAIHHRGNLGKQMTEPPDGTAHYP